MDDEGLQKALMVTCLGPIDGGTGQERVRTGGLRRVVSRCQLVKCVGISASKEASNLAD